MDELLDRGQDVPAVSVDVEESAVEVSGEKPVMEFPTRLSGMVTLNLSRSMRTLFCVIVDRIVWAT